MSFYSCCLALSKALSVILPYILYLVSLGLGCHVTLGDMRKTARNGAALGLYAAAYFVLTPGLWLLILTVLQMPIDYARAFLFVSNSPGGLFGNVLTLWAGGNVGLSIGLTIFGLLLSLVCWAPVAHVWGSVFATGSFKIPLKPLMVECTACVVPIMLGLLCRHYRPHWAYWLRRLVGVMVGFTILSFMLTFFVVKIHVFQDLPWQVWVMGCIGPPSMFLVYLVCRLCPVYRGGQLTWGVKHEEALAITFEFVVKNIGLVLVIAVAVFPETVADKFVAVITSLTLGLHIMYGVAWLMGRHKKRQAQAARPCNDVSQESLSSSPSSVGRRHSLFFGLFSGAQDPQPPSLPGRRRSLFWGLASTQEADSPVAGAGRGATVAASVALVGATAAASDSGGV